MLEEEDLILTDDLTANNIENWDNLAHVWLIMSIVTELGIRLDLPEASNAKILVICWSRLENYYNNMQSFNYAY